MKPRVRAAVIGFAVAVPLLLMAGRAYDESRRVAEARHALASLAAIDEAYRADRGSYANDLGALAEETKDAFGFISSLSRLLDLESGIVVRGDASAYHLEGRALDRRRTLVTLDGPPAPKAAAAKR